MHYSNYNSENVARALGLGGFANDEQLAQAEQAIRLLLLPSFDNELCVTLTQCAGKSTITIVAAKDQIWQQVWPSPKISPVHIATGPIPMKAFDDLVTELRRASTAPSEGRVVILDGIRGHAVLRANRRCEVEINEMLGQRQPYGAFVTAVLQLAWHSVTDPRVRNGLRSVGGLSLPEEQIPEEKPTIRTVVLGPEDVALEIMEGLKKLHQD